MNKLIDTIEKELGIDMSEKSINAKEALTADLVSRGVFGSNLEKIIERHDKNGKAIMAHEYEGFLDGYEQGIKDYDKIKAKLDILKIRQKEAIRNNLIAGGFFNKEGSTQRIAYLVELTDKIYEGIIKSET